MITIHYDCPVCGLKKRELQVPARPAADVDSLLPWMENVLQCVKMDHRNVSPKCKHDRYNLYIPVRKEDEMLGQQTE